MSVAANQVINRAEGCIKSYPVAASTHLYQGTLAFINATGYLDDDTASGANRFAGVVKGEVDNSSGSDGDLKGEVHPSGEFLLVGSGFAQTSVGKPVYASDNYTISLTPTSSKVPIGKVVEYVSATKVWVRLNPNIGEPGGNVISLSPGLKIMGGSQALDGSNPTSVVTGLTTVLACAVTLRGSSAPGDNTSVLTTSDNATPGTIDVYAWKNTGGSDPTLVASTGTDTFDWIAIGY